MAKLPRLTPADAEAMLLKLALNIPQLFLRRRRELRIRRQMNHFLKSRLSRHRIVQLLFRFRHLEKRLSRTRIITSGVFITAQSSHKVLLTPIEIPNLDIALRFQRIQNVLLGCNRFIFFGRIRFIGRLLLGGWRRLRPQRSAAN